MRNFFIFFVNGLVLDGIAFLIRWGQIVIIICITNKIKDR